MRLEVKERGSKEYYNEFLYVVSRHKKFKKNPRRKSYQFTKYLVFYNIFTFFVLLLNFYFYLDTKKTIFIFIDDSNRIFVCLQEKNKIAS